MWLPHSALDFESVSCRLALHFQYGLREIFIVSMCVCLYIYYVSMFNCAHATSPSRRITPTLTVSPPPSHTQRQRRLAFIHLAPPHATATAPHPHPIPQHATMMVAHCPHLVLAPLPSVISRTFTYVFRARPSVTELFRELPHLPSTPTRTSQTRARCVTSKYLTLLILPSILVPSLTPYELIP